MIPATAAILAPWRTHASVEAYRAFLQQRNSAGTMRQLVVVGCRMMSSRLASMSAKMIYTLLTAHSVWLVFRDYSAR
jgi:hypothetical protein